jgi:methionine-rich copper-binding protein CopC
MKQRRLTFRARLLLAAVAAILVPAAVAAPPAVAHDSLSSTAPSRDAVLATAPDTVSLTLSEPPLNSEQLNTTVLTVTDSAGKTVSDAKVTVDGSTLSTKIAAGNAGTYTVLWRAVGSDGHPIEGKYSFTVNAAAGTPPASATPAEAARAAPAAAQPAKPATAGVVDRAPSPDNSNAPLTLGIAAAVLAAAAAMNLFIRSRRKNATS